MAAAYAAHALGLSSAEEAIGLIKASRAEAGPNDGFVAQLDEWIAARAREAAARRVERAPAVKASARASVRLRIFALPDGCGVDVRICGGSIGRRGEPLQRKHGALCLARHGARQDYDSLSAGENWVVSAERPWDPPLSARGMQQGARLGRGVAARVDALGQPPVRLVVTSPLLRCVQTAAAAASELGVSEICIEPALAEGLSESWFRSWAVAGADSTWGGPPHARNGTPMAEDAESHLHPRARQPADTLLMTATEAAVALEQMSDPLLRGVSVSSSYVPLSAKELASELRGAAVVPPLAKTGYRWGDFETEEQLAARMEAALRAIASRYLRLPADGDDASQAASVLCCSHGGPCEHGYRGLLEGKACKDHVTGYTALYCFVRERPGGEWTAPIVADQRHLQANEAGKEAGDS